MTAAPARLRLRLPRALVDPRLTGLPVGHGDGLVALELEQRQGRITALRPLEAGSRTGDAPALPLALTPLVEPHAHLDKCFTAAAFPNPEGTIAGALAANRCEDGQRTYEQVLARGERALDRAWRHGVRAIRSHIDSGGAAARPSWEALLELRRRWADRVHLQLVALVPLAHWSSPEGEALARWVADHGGWLGGVLGPPYGHLRSDRDALATLLGLAERLGTGVDLHVDEAEDQPGRGVDLVSAVASDLRSGVPITCSHAASLALLGPRRQERLAERLAAAGIAVVALPLTNLWLLGRRPERTPWLRLQAPIRSLQRAGVLVAVGGDNVQDPWYPGGDFDPIELLRLSPLTSHLWPATRQGLTPFSTAPARLLGLEWDGVVREGGPADLVLLDAGSWPELLARTPQRLVLRAGRALPPPALQQPAALLPAASMG
ncbi:amidohydrolase family protein [Cyanobium sp. CH-040]|uniref:amidohydrolase family protein n=1 Tax=Cyanobium sp. CH-040 TaxID=2823708 RepID=UPI0020CE0B5A|nr:amidohydrolase family protein [Cyanobium sp. CH-040]MCP9926424.1 amidohydrolase family protein [Cyanobium sp. CH-040]